MRLYESLTEEARAIVDDLVDEMAEKTWTERRYLINRVLEVERAALSLRAEANEAEPSDSVRQRGIVAQLLALALERLAADEAVCGDSAMVLSISADQRHRRAAREWFEAHPGIWETLQPTLH